MRPELCNPTQMNCNMADPHRHSTAEQSTRQDVTALSASETVLWCGNPTAGVGGGWWCGVGGARGCAVGGVRRVPAGACVRGGVRSTRRSD